MNLKIYMEHWLIPTFLAVMLGLMVIRVLVVWRFRTLLQAHNWELCACCGYCLTGLPDRRQCPECGAPYTLKETRAKWQTMFGASTGG